MDGDQLSPFDLSHDPVTTPASSASEEAYGFLQQQP
jgi:hypothetical protein